MLMLRKNNSERSPTRSDLNKLWGKNYQPRAGSAFSAFVIEPGQPILCEPHDITDMAIPEAITTTAIMRMIDFMIEIVYSFVAKKV
jgi:hypothetical protein